MRDEFLESLVDREDLFGISLDQERREKLVRYYEFLTEANAILHLVGPCSPAEFATRHVLESLTVLEFLPANTRFADVGSGGGLPAIPCLLVRDDLSAVLIEAKEKKAAFLVRAADEIGITDRTRVVNRQFEEVTEKNFEFVVCRALDKFADKLPRLLKWSGKRGLLLFGGPNLETSIRKARRKFKRKLMPLSEQRYLFILEPDVISRSRSGS